MPADCGSASLYRPRSPRATPLYRLAERYCDEVKGLWEECFEGGTGAGERSLTSQSCATWCGIHDCGFARVRCPECRAEVLVVFSCQTRPFYPSCAAKRSAVRVK